MPGKARHLITFQGKTQSVWAWAKELGIAPATIYSRLRLGWDLADVLARPTSNPLPAPAPRPKLPVLGEHSSGQARCVYKGHSYYFGPAGSAEAIAGYARFCRDLEAGIEPAAGTLSVAELLQRFWTWCRSYHLDADGKPNGQCYGYWAVIQAVNEAAGTLDADQFGPAQLASLRQQFLAHQGRNGRWTRQTVNERLCQVRRIWSWAVGEGLVPASVADSLRHVRGARKTKVSNPEQRKRPGVTWDRVKATLPYLEPFLAAMVELHWLAGCRSSEICVLRPCDLEKQGRGYLWYPHRYKTAAQTEPGQELAYWFGPRAAKILASILNRFTGTYLFPGPAGHARTGKRAGRWTRNTYAKAIGRACKRAGIEPWSPRQIRKGRATEIELTLHQKGQDGRRAAQAVCGHTDPSTTERHYLDRLALAKAVQMELG